MKLLLSIFIAASVLLFPSNRKKTVLFFGDSITEIGVQEKGYISLLSKRLAEEGKSDQFDVIGSGIGGNKIYDLYFRMERDVLPKNPDIVVIWIGVNDVWHKSSFGTGSDIYKFEPMYAEIIKKLQAKGIEVFCATPACIGEKTDFSNAQDGDLNEFSKVIRRLAKDNKAGLVDFRKLFLDYNLANNTDNLSKGILTNDGVHLNDKGNEMVADAIWTTVLFPSH